MIQDFSSFHNHSHFSTMDGISLPEEIILSAKEKGLKSIALTDHGSCHGHADFFLSGKKHGVRTVFGNEAYVIHSLAEWNELREKLNLEKELVKKERDTNSRQVDDLKSTSKSLYRKGHLVLLACNREGLSNLYRLTYDSYKYGFYGKPRMDKEMLRRHSRGLIASSACMGGVISNKCWNFRDGTVTWKDVVDEAREFDEIFGRGRFFLELQFNESEGQKFINECLVKIHDETGIPLTVTTDSHYTRQDEWEAQELLYMLRDKTTMATRGDDWSFEVRQLYIKSPEEMWQTYEKFAGVVSPNVAIEAFRNTLLMDSLIENYEPDIHQRLPTLPYKNPFEEMGRQAIEGLKKLNLADNDQYKARLLHELKVIKEKGLSNYFLILRKIIEEAKKEMYVGAGRGSAAGSLVCYALGITDLDPIQHDLMFERFLDPARTENPDIDTDFEDTDAAKDLLRRMFGEDNVASLSTYGTFQIKGLLKDLARIYDLDHNEMNKINKAIQKELGVLYVNQDKSTIVIKLDDIQRVSKTFNKFVEENPQVGKHLKKLYGRNKYIGCHAAGVVIGDDLPSETACFYSKGIAQTSFTEGIVNKNVSAMGFVKFDILSIACLKIIHHAVRLVSKKTGVPEEELRENLRPHRLDLNDPQVMKRIFWDGNFAGIFQFTNNGIRRLAQNVRPDTFIDVSAITSLYRPGPLGGKYDKVFVHNKRNPDDVKYAHPLLENILKKTRGCIVFQEQLMQICNVLGKMSMKDVNRVRKVLLKKDKSKSEEFLKKENDELSGKFFAGCKENGMEELAAKKLWEDLLKFGGYGFNKAHSDAYTVMTMQTAHLATYHPLEFYSAVLTKGQAGEMQDYIEDIRKAGVKVLPVNINSSGLDNSVEGNAIRLSLLSVLGVGASAANKIVASQPYTSFIDFLDRSGASKTAILPLIKVGAFDSLEPDMGQLLAKYEFFCDDTLKLGAKKNRDKLEELFSTKLDVPDVSPLQRLEFEIELLGFNVKGSPFTILERDKKISAVFDGVVSEYSEVMGGKEETVMLPVVVKDIKERPQKNGLMMSFIKFGTTTGEEFESPCFGNVWKWLRNSVKKGNVYVTLFNRKEDDPSNLVVGRPGFAHSQHSCSTYMVNVDEISL